MIYKIYSYGDYAMVILQGGAVICEYRDPERGNLKVYELVFCGV